MAEDDKGFSFKRLFFREEETVAEQNQAPAPEPAVKNIQDHYVSNTPLATPVTIQEQPMLEDFVQRLQNLINQNNQPGFDFLEFTESLFEEKQNPTPDVYKTVFRIAQKIDKSLTPAKLLESAFFYKNLVQQTVESEVSKGETKKKGLQTDKDTERTNLDNSLKDIRAKIQQLTKQIQDLQNQDMATSNQLLAIDQKYGSQFIDIDRKLNAIRSAKDQVLVSIVDIESGIKANL